MLNVECCINVNRSVDYSSTFNIQNSKWPFALCVLRALFSKMPE